MACCAHGSANRATRGPCIRVDACCPSRRARIRVWLDDERRAQGLGRGRACRDMTQRRVGDTWSCWLRGRKGLVDGISPCDDGRRRGVPGVQTTSPCAAVGRVHGEAYALASRAAALGPSRGQATLAGRKPSRAGCPQATTPASRARPPRAGWPPCRELSRGPQPRRAGRPPRHEMARGP